MYLLILPLNLGLLSHFLIHFLLRKSSKTLEQVTQGGGGGVTIAGGIQGRVGHGAQGHALVGDIGGKRMVGQDDLGGIF